MFESPLVPLKRLQGQVGHLHVDEVRYRASDKKLFQCSYTFGVMDASKPASLRYLAENLKHKIPDDTRTPGCIHLAPDGDVVYTTHRGNLSNPTFITGWNISDPAKPVQLPVLQEPGESYEGIDVANGKVFVALRDNGLGVYARDTGTNVLSRVGSLSNLGSTWGVRVRDNTAFVTDILGGLSIVNVTDPAAPALLGKVAITGVAKGLVVEGNLAYVAAGNGGLVVVDVTDLTQPKVIGHVDTDGAAIRVAYSEGRVFVAAWNDARVYDVAKPEAPRFIGAVRLTTEVAYPDDGHPPVTARTMGIAANGRDIFVGNWWVNYAYRLYPDRVAPHIVLPETVNLMDFGPVAAGMTSTLKVPVENQGTAPLTLFQNWASGTSFSVTPKQLRVAPGERGELTVEYKAAGAEKETGILYVRSDDPAEPVRTAFLVGNQAGLGVGKPLPETKATLLDGSDWSSSSNTGKVKLLGYFATFCPVCSVEVRDFESRFKKKYGDNVEIVLLNANGDPIDGVQKYVKNLHITYVLGLEDPTTQTYAKVTENYKGANPFPVDIVVGKDGLIRYIAREYDPNMIEAAVDAELAK
jgi:peroxiredoxin